MQTEKNCPAPFLEPNFLFREQESSWTFWWLKIIDKKIIKEGMGPEAPPSSGAKLFLFAPNNTQAGAQK